MEGEYFLLLVFSAVETLLKKGQQNLVNYSEAIMLPIDFISIMPFLKFLS